MKYIVDRTEGDFALCETENEELVTLPLKDLPTGVKEGSVLIREENCWRLDEEEASARRKRLAEKMAMLRK